MARMLSEISRRGLYLAAIIVAPLTAEQALADEGRPSAEPVIVQNPFSVGAPRPAALVKESSPPRREDSVYRNPFSARSTLPPIETPRRLPGPISRWQRSALPLEEPSAVKTAILSAEPIQHIHIPWDQLPPVESLRDRAVSGSKESDVPAADDLESPPDPLRFTATPLAQPAWLAGDGQPMQTVSPIGQASFDQAIAGGRVGTWASGPAQMAPRAADIEPLVVTDIDNSPAISLAEAQQAANNAQSLDDYSTVARLCERGLVAGPTAELSTSLRRLAAWAHNRRGEVLADEGQQHQAIEAFQTAIALDGNCSLAIHNRAVTLAQQNQLTAALCDFNRVLELNPGLAVAYRNRAELFAALGRMEQAVADYSRAIEALPDDAELYAARGYAWQRLGDFKRAGADFNRAIEIAPDRPDAYLQRGNLAADRGDYDRALTDFRQAIAIDSNCAEAYRSVAWLHATCADEDYRDAERALAAARKAAGLSGPGEYLVLDALAAAYATAGQFHEAVEIGQQAIAAAPPELAAPLQQRLALYQGGRPFRSESSATAGRTEAQASPSPRRSR